MIMRRTLCKSLFLLAAIVSFSVCGATADDPYDLKGKTHSAVTPVPRTDAEWWMPRHRKILKRMGQGNVDLIFIGDSITHYWENRGRTVWDRYYAPRKAVNMGFSGGKTGSVLWQIEQGEVDGINPKLTAIMIGTNNRNPAEETADGIKAIVQQLRTRLPETKILILAIFPRGCYEDRRLPEVLQSGMNDLWTSNQQVNQIVSKIADNQMIYYLDIGSAFLNDGMVLRKYLPDFLHPNAEGYQVRAEALEPTLKQLLGEG
jgi:beta-glucosidase